MSAMHGRSARRPRGSDWDTGAFALVLVADRRRHRLRALARSPTLSIRDVRLRFLDRPTTWDPVAGEFGALPFIWGTLYSSILALLHLPRPSRSASRSSCPNCAPHWLRQPLVFLTELLAAIPSIVYGLWGIFVLVPIGPRRCSSACPTGCGRLPLFSGPPVGVEHAAGRRSSSPSWSCPFTSSVAREVLKAVPVAQREGGLRARRDAVGGDHASPSTTRATGIVGAVMLGFGRALGETMAVTMVIGNSPQVSLVALRAAVHDGGGHRQRVHRGRRRPPPARAGRDRPGAVRHHAGRQRRCRGC